MGLEALKSNMNVSYYKSVLRMYCIDTEVFMFNKGSSYGLAFDPIFTSNSIH